jgi:glycosyltransferase involved in cell wall biosynthesis
MSRAADAPGRVLMIVENNSYPRDPRVRREAEGLAAAGYLVSVISPALPKQPLRETLGGIFVYRYPGPPEANGFLTYIYEYAYSTVAIFALSLWVFLGRGFDVIHTANPPDTLVFVAAFYKLFGKRFIFDHHDLAPDMYYARFEGRGNRLVYRVLFWCEKLSCKLADHVIATNQSYKRIEMERHGVPEERITVVRNGPDPKRLRAVEPDPVLRKRAGTILAFAGITGYQNGVIALPKVLRCLVYDLGKRDVLFVIIGDGHALPEMKKMARDFALEDYVWFTGWVDDPSAYIRYLSTADICIDPTPSCTSNDASTMIKLMEYMSLGKPVVAFDVPEGRYSAQSAALYAKPNIEADMARAIAELIDDPQRRQAMGQFGRNRIETELAWSYSLPNLLEVYHRVLPGRLTRSSTTVQAIESEHSKGI